MAQALASTHPWVAEGGQRIRFGIETIPLPDWSATRDFIQMVEGLGFDSLWLPDHPVVTGHAIWPTLASFAQATQSVRLGTLVNCVYYWNPVVLARCAADVDRLSNGRLVVGLGSGDMPFEFEYLGIEHPPVRQRQATLEESLQIIRPLLRGETTTMHGTTYQANGVTLEPPPSQQPYVPLLVAGGGEQTTLKFVAQYADVSNLGAASWAGHAFTPNDARHKFEVLQRHCQDAGRPYESVLRTGLIGMFLSESPDALRTKMEHVPPQILGFFEQLPVVGTPDEAVRRTRELLEAGFQYVIFIVLPFDTESLQLVAQRVIPELGAANGRPA
jgi:alkanesulfonate monooxygenase SsuD/methylene tetrahydromethanopterin reductase-like flavin-dependent oxidoreductase (luciferase family)